MQRRARVVHLALRHRAEDAIGLVDQHDYFLHRRSNRLGIAARARSYRSSGYIARRPPLLSVAVLIPAAAPDARSPPARVSAGRTQQSRPTTKSAMSVRVSLSSESWNGHSARLAAWA